MSLVSVASCLNCAIFNLSGGYTMTKTAAIDQAIREPHMYREGSQWVVTHAYQGGPGWFTECPQGYASARESLTNWRAERALGLLGADPWGRGHVGSLRERVGQGLRA